MIYLLIPVGMALFFVITYKAAQSELDPLDKKK